MKKIFKTICIFCLATSVSLSVLFAQNVGTTTKSDNIPEYLEIDDNEIFFTPVEDEYEQAPVSGATLAWRDIRPDADPNVTPSRSVTIGLNQYLEVEYPGNEWIYLGETEETNHLRYFGRKLGRDDTKFTLCSKDAGTVILHFYCIDPLNGTSISDYLEVIVEDRTSGTSSKVVAPSYAKTVPGGQHSNDFDYITPTVKDVHKEPETPYTLEVPNPPKENTVAVPKTSSTGKSSTTGKSTSSTTQTTTSKPATSSSSASSTAPASSSTSKSSSSSTSSASTKPAASSTTKNSSTSTTKSTSSTTQTTTTKPATSSSSATKNTSSATTSTAPATSSSSSTRSASSGSTSTSSTSTSSGKSSASASIATGNPTTRSISRSASSPSEDSFDTEDYDDMTTYSYEEESYDYPSYGSSSSSSSIASGPSIAANTGSDYSSLSGSELLEKAREAYKNAKYAECLSYLDEFFISSTSETDEALYLQGQALEAPGSSRNIKGALEAYETLVKNYPYSKYWEPANERVIYIKRFYINIR